MSKLQRSLPSAEFKATSLFERPKMTEPLGESAGGLGPDGSDVRQITVPSLTKNEVIE